MAVQLLNHIPMDLEIKLGSRDDLDGDANELSLDAPMPRNKACSGPLLAKGSQGEK